MESDEPAARSLESEVERLRHIEQTFQALFQKSPIGIAYHRVIVDELGRPVNYLFIDANDNYKELTGIDPRGKLVNEAFPGIEKDPFDWIGTFGRVALEGETIRFQQYLETNDRWYDAVGYQSSPGHFVAAFIEITEVKKREAELDRYRNHLEELVAERTRELEDARDAAEAANRAKSVFLANISHELRTPLNAVLGYADILQSRESDAHNRTYLEAIRKSGHALLSLINDVLDLSRIESGKLEVATRPVSMRELADEISAIFAGNAGVKDLAFRTTVAGRVPAAVDSDPVRLRQILVNLVGNAIKFTDFGSVELTIDAAPEAAGTGRSDTGAGGTPDGEETVALSLVVRDSGKGISASDRERIFESFVQARNQRPGDYEGAGLGLSITRRIVGELGGTIAVTDNPGGGSVFTVTLPAVAVVAEEVAGPVGIDPDAVDLSGVRIAVVDDIEYNRDLLNAYLKPTGAEVLLAGDGDAAVSLVRRERPDLVLMDYKLPRRDGVEATRALKDDPTTRSIPVVFVTASSTRGDEELIRPLAAGYLRKPVSRRVLLTEVVRHVSGAPLAVAPTAREDASTAMVDGIPSASVRARIRGLAADGDLAAVLRAITELEERQGGVSPFTGGVRLLAETYEDERLIAFIDAVAST